MRRLESVLKVRMAPRLFLIGMLFASQSQAQTSCDHGFLGMNAKDATIISIPDCTGDGVRDIVIGQPYDRPDGTLRGRVYLFSGASGDLVWEVAGERDGEHMGMSLAYLLPGAERSSGAILAGAPEDKEHLWNGKTRVVDSGRIYELSLASGHVVRYVGTDAFSGPFRQLGLVMASVGDSTTDQKLLVSNCDGQAAVLTWPPSPSRVQSMAVTDLHAAEIGVLSQPVKTSPQLLVLSCPPVEKHKGRITCISIPDLKPSAQCFPFEYELEKDPLVVRVVGMQDCNGDGANDFVLANGSLAASDYENQLASIWVFSGKRREEVARINVRDARFKALFDGGQRSVRINKKASVLNRFGASVVLIHDRDGDGLDEIAATFPGIRFQSTNESLNSVQESESSGCLVILSGKDLHPEGAVYSRTAGVSFGDHAQLVEDVDACGQRDIAISNPLDITEFVGRNDITVLSGKSLEALYTIRLEDGKKPCVLKPSK